MPYLGDFAVVLTDKKFFVSIASYRLNILFSFFANISPYYPQFKRRSHVGRNIPGRVLFVFCDLNVFEINLVYRSKCI